MYGNRFFSRLSNRQRTPGSDRFRGTLGRTKTVTHADGPTLTYTYTGDGQLHSVTETLDGVSTLYLYYS